MDTEIKQFILDNYVSEQADLIVEMLECLDRCSTSDEHALLSIIRSSDDVVMSEVANVFTGVIIDNALKCLSDSHIYCSSRSLSTLTPLIKFLYVIYDSPQFDIDIKKIGSATSTIDAMIELVMAYVEVDRESLEETITHVSESIIDSILERAKNLEDTQSVDNSLVKYPDIVLSLISEMCGNDANDVLLLMVEGCSMEYRAETILSISSLRLASQLDTDPSYVLRYMLGIYLGKWGSIRPLAEPDQDDWVRWCSKWHDSASKSRPDHFIKSAKELMAKCIRSYNEG